MTQIVDARGLTCPQPVVLTLKAIAQATEVITIVDNRPAVENVTRLAQAKGCTVAVVEREDGIYLTIRRPDAPAGSPVTEHVAVGSTATAPAGPLVLFVPSDCFGHGPAELGERLMGAFFDSLREVDTKPQTIVFMNSGVKLVIEGARPLEDVRALAAQGIDVLVCGTCLGYFGLTEQLAVGRISNMYDIATVLLEAGKIVEL
ncbi:MAG: sulfurtransferase-like selenium metabolism protein YedF [Myxococcota bacterium]|jgi:selenium metabolism protein YedF|nr:sulfurtransferase-like selenium metabolism protein YedF [Myxococcota bacterium]